MLEDLKPEITALQGRLAEMEKALDVTNKKEKIAELEYKMGEPTFWDDAELAQKINQELNDVKISVDKYEALLAKFDDVQVMWEIGMEEKDESMEADVKADMEKAAPMDRLVCGDVGFGKTEVAIRAAFKAACDSKQVAVLVPTTVLALQHYQNFRDRLRDFPVRVDYLSRARTAKQTKQVLEDL